MDNIKKVNTMDRTGIQTYPETDLKTEETEESQPIYKTSHSFISRFIILLESASIIFLFGSSVVCLLYVHKFSGWAAVGTFCLSAVLIVAGSLIWKMFPADIRKIFERYPTKAFDKVKNRK